MALAVIQGPPSISHSTLQFKIRTADWKLTSSDSISAHSTYSILDRMLNYIADSDNYFLFKIYYYVLSYVW